jgi:hypothetical protein
MPANKVSASANIDTIGYAARFDLVSGKLSVDLSPTIWITGPSSVLGARLIITSPSSKVISNGSTYISPILGPILYDIPLFKNIYEWGIYQFRLIIEESPGYTCSIDGSFDLCAPQDNQHDRGLVHLELNSDCENNVLKAYGGSGATYKGKSPETWSSRFTIYYPTASGRLPEIVQNFPAELSLFQGLNKIQGYSVGHFVFDGNYSVDIVFNGMAERYVQCSFPCFLFCNYKKLVHATLNGIPGSKDYANNVELLAKVEHYMDLIQFGFKCGENVDEEVQIVSNLLGCDDCGCDDTQVMNTDFSVSTTSPPTTTTTTLFSSTTTTTGPGTTTTTIPGQTTTTTTSLISTTTTAYVCPSVTGIEMNFGGAPVTSTTTSDPNAVIRYASVADAIAIPNANPGDLLITAGNDSGGANIYINAANFIQLDNTYGSRKILIHGGNYDLIHIESPGTAGTNAHPIIITNYNGQVRTREIRYKGLVHCLWTGRYDPVAQTGDPNFLGHDLPGSIVNGVYVRGGVDYSYTSGKYGFYIDKQWGDISQNCITIQGSGTVQTSYFEGEYFEYGNGGFSFQIKSPGLTETMYGMVFHDFFGHNPHGEGKYVGDTASGLRHLIQLHCYNARLLMTGNDGFQGGQLAAGSIIENNVVHGSINWRSCFDENQDSCLQLGICEGNVIVRNNLFFGCGQQFINLQMDEQSVSTPNGLPIQIYNNHFAHCAGPRGVYLGQANPIMGSTLQFHDNIFSRMNYIFDEAYNHVSPNYYPNGNYVVRSVLSNTQSFTNNIWDGSGHANFLEFSVSAPSSASGNVIQAVEDIPFVDYISTLPANFDYARLFGEWVSRYFATWGDEYNISSVTNQGQLKNYTVGEYAVRKSRIYRCTQAHSNIEPGAGVNWQNFWAVQTFYAGATFPCSDVRMQFGSVHNQRGIGLLDNPTSAISTTTTTTTSAGTTTSTTTSAPPTGTSIIAASIADNGDNTFTITLDRNRATLTSNSLFAGQGSSSMYGIGTTSPNKFGDLLQGQLDSNTSEGSFLNMAVSGTDSRSFMPDGDNANVMIHRNIDAVIALKPTALLLWLPTNDTANGLSATTFINNLMTIYNKAWGNGIPCFIGSPLPRSNFSTSQKADLVTVNNYLLANIPDQVRIDNFAFFNDGSGNILSQYDSGDGTHLNNAGMVIAESNWWTKINAYFADQTWLQYEVERSTTSPTSGFSVIDIVANGTLVKTYSRVNAGTNYYRVRAKLTNGTYTSYSNVMSLAQPNLVGTLDQKIQLDFSVDTYTPAPVDWNNLAVPIAGPTLNQSFALQDIAPSPTALHLVVTKLFSGSGGGGGSFSGITVRATEDNWYLNNNTLSDVAQLKITGCDPAKVYNADIYSTRQGSDYNRWTSFEASHSRESVRAAYPPNGDPNTTVVGHLRGLVPNSGGEIIFSLRAFAGTGYINAMVLSRYDNTGTGTTTTTSTTTAAPTTTTTTSATTTTTTTAGTTTTTTAGTTTTTTSGPTTTTTTAAANKLIQVAVNSGGTTAYGNAAWNDFILPAGATTATVTQSALKYADGTVSTVSVSLENSSVIGDNGSTYGTGTVNPIFPLPVLRYYSRYSGLRHLWIDGLDTAKKYSIELVGSRGVTGHTDLFTVGGVQQLLATFNNFTQSIVYTDQVPDGTGRITITIDKNTADGSVFDYLNGFKITDTGAASGTTTTTTTAGTTTTTTTSGTTTTTTTSGTTTTTTTSGTTTTTTTAGGTTPRSYAVGSTPYTGSQYAKVYLPAGYGNNSNNYPTYIFLHGTGERGDGLAAINTIDNTGLPQKLNGGQNHDFIVICPQLTTAQGSWQLTIIQAAINWAKANYRVDNNRIYMGGLSLGASGTYDYCYNNVGVIAYADFVSGGSYGPYTAFYRQPVTFSHGEGDTTLGADNSYNAFSGINANTLQPKPNPSPWIHLYYQTGHSASVWNNKVFDISLAPYRFDKRALLHSLVPEDQATNYVVAAETGTADYTNFYFLALRLVNALAASSTKTSLQARLATVLTNIRAIYSRRWVVKLGTGATSPNVNSATTAETSDAFTSFVDDGGTASGVGLTVVLKAITWTAPITSSVGLNNEYFGLPADLWANPYRTYGNGGTLKFTGLDNAKLYKIRFYTGALDASNTEEGGVSIIIGSTVKYLSSQFNTESWIEFDSLAPTAGEISFNWAALPTLVAGQTPTNEASGAKRVTTSQVASYNATNGWMAAIVLLEKAL